MRGTQGFLHGKLQQANSPKCFLAAASKARAAATSSRNVPRYFVFCFTLIYATQSEACTCQQSFVGIDQRCQVITQQPPIDGSLVIFSMSTCPKPLMHCRAVKVRSLSKKPRKRFLKTNDASCNRNHSRLYFSDEDYTGTCLFSWVGQVAAGICGLSFRS